MTKRVLKIGAVFCGGLILLPAGCVKPDPEKPWSTKAQSRGGGNVVEGDPGNDDLQVVAAGVRERNFVDFDEDIIRVRPADNVSVSISPEETSVSVSARERALALLLKAVNDEHPLLRTNGYEGLEWMPESLAEVAPRGLSDENRAVRFAAAMTVGATKIDGMALYLEPLLLDESDSVHAAAIYALRSLGVPADPSPLAKYVMSDDPETRANTYIVLGYINNSSAIPLIQSSLGVGMRLANPMRVKLTELQAANVLVHLGDQNQVEPLRAALFAPVEQGELTILACEFLGEIGDEQARPMIQRILTAPGKQQRPLEIRVAAAKALYRLGEMPSPGLEGVIMLGAHSEDPRLRSQAASALVFVPGAHAESVLLGMLDDPDPLVATATAAAIAQRGASTIGQ